MSVRATGNANRVGEPSDASGRQSTRIGSTDVPVLVFAVVVFITVANNRDRRGSGRLGRRHWKDT
jgi:hypothetical protein